MKRYLLAIAGSVLAGAGISWAQEPASSLPAAAPTGSPTLSLKSAADDKEADNTKKDAATPGVGQDPVSAGNTAVENLPPGSIDYTKLADMIAQRLTAQTQPSAPASASAPVIVEGETFNENGARNRLWASGEYLLWWTKKSPEPAPLVTTFPATSPFVSSPPIGALGGPNTSVVLGGRDIDTSTRHGGRFSAGYWFDSCQTWGLEGSFFFLGQRQVTQSVTTPGTPGSANLAVPFVDATAAPGTNPEGTLVLGGSLFGPNNPFPGRASLALSSSLHGAELNGFGTLCSGTNWRLGALAGFRYLNLHETLQFSTNSDSPSFIFRAATRTTLDQFETRNQFYGGQIGLKGEVRWGRMFLDAGAKFAWGSMHEIADISGANEANFRQAAGTGPLPGVGFSIPLAGPGGIFTQPSNIGHYSRDRFAVVPEGNVKVGYEFASWLRGFVGYTFLYVDHVARPGSQIDRTLNLNQSAIFVPNPPGAGAARPAFSFNDSSFWAQGVSFGLELRY